MGGLFSSLYQDKIINNTIQKLFSLVIIGLTKSLINIHIRLKCFLANSKSFLIKIEKGI